MDLYSNTVDPIVTKAYLQENVCIGREYPKVQGVATAYHAVDRFPTLSLEDAVIKYIELKSQPRAPSPPPELGPDHFLKTYKGYTIRNWDDRDGRSGYLIRVVKESDIQCLRDIGCLPQGNSRSYVVTSEQESKDAVDAILKIMDSSFHLKHLSSISFSGHCAFLQSEKEFL